MEMEKRVSQIIAAEMVAIQKAVNWNKEFGRQILQFQYCQDRMDDCLRDEFQLLNSSWDNYGLECPYGYCLDNIAAR